MRARHLAPEGGELLGRAAVEHAADALDCLGYLFGSRTFLRSFKAHVLDEVASARLRVGFIARADGQKNGDAHGMSGWHVAGDKAYSIVENSLVIQYEPPSAFYLYPILLSIEHSA